MRTGRPKEQLELSAGERTQLESFVRSCSLLAARGAGGASTNCFAQRWWLGKRIDRHKARARWTVRSVAAETGISKSSVQRYFQLFGLKPNRSESFKLSTDAFFVEVARRGGPVPESTRQRIDYLCG